MNMRRIMMFCLLLPLYCIAVQPYTPTLGDPVVEPWRWRHETDLENLNILCMDEAENGTFWFGCVGGIVQYDGTRVEKITFSEELLKKIMSLKDVPWAKALTVRPNGDLLVLIGESLVLRHGEEWEVVVQNVGESVLTARLVDGVGGDIWLGVPDGLWRIPADGSSSSQVMTPSMRQGLKSLCRDSAGDIWVVEKTGLVSSRLVHIPCLNGQPAPESDWRKFAVPFENDHNEAHIVFGRDELIWYVDESKNSRLEAFDPGTGQWLQRGEMTPLKRYYSLVATADGSVWGGAEGRLIKSLPNGHDEFYNYDRMSLPRVPITLFEDSTRRLWMLGRVGLVYSADLSDEKWFTYRGLHFEFETEDGVRWFRSQPKISYRHVVSHDTRSGEWVEYNLEDGVLERGYRLLQSSHGLIWVAGMHANKAAVAVFDGKKWQRFLHPGFAHFIEPNSVFETADGTVWFGAGGNLLLDEPNAGGALQYEVTDEGVVRLLKHHAPPNFPYYVTSLEQTPDGTLWIGSTVLHSYDGTSPNAVPHSELQGENTVDLMLDRNQNLWVLKEHFGVCRRNGESWDIYTAEDGIPSLLLSAMIELEDGSLLVSTSKGLGRFDGRSWADLSDSGWFGMQFRNSSMRLEEDHSVWFNYAFAERYTSSKRIDGAGRFSAIRHRAETTPPETMITDYLERVSQPGNTHIVWAGKDPWGSTPKEKLQFSWRMDGGEWSLYSTETRHTFLNLESGHHVLEIRARDLAFNVDPTPAVAEFMVVAPLWAQTWFQLMVSVFVGLIAFLIWLLFRNRERFLVNQQEEREASLRREQAEREAHLKEMDRLKTGFFTNISHELRTPMTVVAGRLQTILHAEADEKRKNSLSIVLRNAERVSSLVTQLLDFRKIEEGKIQVVATLGDLASLLRDWTASLQVLAEQKEITLSIKHPEVCNGQFDFDKVQKIFINLLSNAIKYTNDGGEVHVVLNVEEDQRVRFIIEDNGLGISPEHLEHIFDRFYRVSEESMAQGAGIGLNLTKELVDLLGGEISVESPISEDPDHPGTRFAVSLPLEQEQESVTRRREDAKGKKDHEQAAGSVGKEPAELRDFATSRESAVKSVSGDGAASREEMPLILTVEDDACIRELIVEGLESDYRVETAENGEIGLQKAKEMVPDLIIADVMMPVMDGMTMCSELKTSMETSHIPVVMLTAKAARESQIEGLKTGADDYITKPFHMDLLQVRIANLLKSRRLLREKFQKELPSLSNVELPSDAREQAFLSKLTAVLEENHSDFDFKLDEFSHAMNMSGSSLLRKSKAITGYTPIELLNDFRMKRVVALLVQTSGTIGDIAFSCGMPEPSNFNRMFKKHFQMTPSQYRDEKQQKQ